eukprot:CAMPEP_0172410744 /NCGR_PEP_ID=MMETSP1061-20121228/77039_1 /TAXON_ID=37318 /ORGANISM="Pseudo-nitzschia pungens, Strain cf. pungens" /LENGTH=145 /DNA_ID=CAMNT_0013146937 /DNA_START=527 /DNA_END=964 /DNA_ORIENTATION=+
MKHPVTATAATAAALLFVTPPALGFASVHSTSKPSPFLANNNCHKMSSTQVGAGAEIEVISQPDDNFLKEKGVFSWGTWGCGVSKFPWTYGQSESCYLLAGKVTVTPSDGRQPATFGKGDYVTFPADMSCTWDVTEAVQKHFVFF